MLTSIIIPAKNEEKCLAQLLDSISQQNMKTSDIEVIVADAGSTDKTLKIARAHECKVVLGGLPAVGRNNGAKVARGDILVFKDSDSYLPNKDFLEKSVREFNERKLDVATPLCYPLHHRNGFAGKRYEWYFNSFANPTMEKAENTPDPLMMNYMIVRKKVFDEIGGFDESLEFGEDAEYAKRAKQAGFEFGILRNCGKIGFNMRNAEKSLLDEARWLFVNIYFTRGRKLGHEFKRGKTKVKYWR